MTQIAHRGTKLRNEELGAPVAPGARTSAWLTFLRRHIAAIVVLCGLLALATSLAMVA